MLTAEARRLSVARSAQTVSIVGEKSIRLTEGRPVAATSTFSPGSTYSRDDDGDELIARSSWSLRFSGIIAGVLLVIGRSASYGNITWTPFYHQVSSPLVVIEMASKHPAPIPGLPKTVPNIDPALLSKRSAAAEVVTFSPGKMSPGSDDASGGNAGSGSATTAHDSHNASGASATNGTAGGATEIGIAHV